MKKLLFLLFSALCANAVWGQYGFVGADMPHRLGMQQYRLDTAMVNTLGVEVDALAFFKDNEYDGSVQYGYSLPGVRLTPRLVYTPIKEVSLELGVYAIFYHGANKYPCYAYHDIPRWKGNQYTRGVHVLPYFRASAHFKNITLALGDIYGGTVHQLVEPLYNPELLLTEDPEMGFQMIVDLRRWHSDIWVNWQSFIFKGATHQEAFTVGWTQRVKWLESGGAEQRHHLYSPVQLVIQHRGGEDIDMENSEVQTLCNAAVGVGYDFLRPGKRGFTGLHAEVCALACMQQSGSLWPFKKGFGVWGEVSADFIKDLRASVGVFSARDFCSLYGSPFYGTLSIKTPSLRFPHMTTVTLGVEYSRTFARRYTVGGNVKTYIASPGGEVQTPFSFGVYFRANPYFVLKRFRR